MQLDVGMAVEILQRTPATLKALLRDLPSEWTRENEGGESWSPYDVVGHLIHGEKTDWIPRAERILEHGESKEFDPFDRFAQLEESKGKSLERLLDEFEELRARNVRKLLGLDLHPADLSRTGRHPHFGRVTLGQLLSTWVAHDLGHIGQIARVMAKQYRDEVGPWKAYLPILWRRPPAESG